MPAAEAFQFYSALPVCASFEEALKPDSARPVPEGWVLIVADVVASTTAIAKGAYKEVNLAGCAILAAAFDILGHHVFPFVFGGDGASLALPGRLKGALRPALESARAMARDAFGLDLRIGVFAVEDLRAAGFEVGVSRFKLSENFTLAMFHGAGLARAEALLKQPDQGEPFRISLPEGAGLIRFESVECRWEPIVSRRGVVLSLIVATTTGKPSEDAAVLEEFLLETRRVLGEDGGHPVPVDALALGRGRTLEAEARFRVPRPGFARLVCRMRVAVETALGRWLMGRGVRTPGVDWGNYRPDAARNSDFRKYDGMLRMVLSMTRGEADRVVAWLDLQHARGRLAYGVHRSDAALMTCLIFNRAGGHLHLIDGDGGGYALAAQDLKRRTGSTVTRAGFPLA